MKKKEKFAIGIYKKASVEKYFKIIGFSNIKNIKRYEKYSKRKKI